MNVNGRIARLERIAPERACAHCQSWPAHAISWDGRRLDAHPLTCPGCGRLRRQVRIKYQDGPETNE